MRLIDYHNPKDREKIKKLEVENEDLKKRNSVKEVNELKKRVSKDQFQAFEDVRVSGITNMWDTECVAEHSGGFLERKDVLFIIKHYNELVSLYPGVRKNK